MRAHVHDDLFGTLRYEFGWRGTYELPFFGKAYALSLVVPTDDDLMIADHQRQTFRSFHSDRSRLLPAAEEAIYAYYRGSLPELRERFGETLADQIAPTISSSPKLAALITPTELLVQEDLLESGKRVVGLLCDCTWEPSLGLAVRFENEAISDIGTQDIVL
jgi:hypothetical protein